MPYDYGLLDNSDFIKDVCTATRLAFVDSAKIRFFQDLNQFVILNDWFGGKKGEIIGGTNIKFLAMVRWENVARHINERDQDSMAMPNVMETMFAPWVIANTNYAWTKNTILANDRAEKPSVALVKVLDAQRLNALYSISRLLEGAAWTFPATETQDKTPWGIPYWVPLGPTAQVGWVGMNPPGWTNCAGVDSSDAANSGWRSYSNRSTAFTTVDDAAFAMLEKTFLDMQFRAPFKIGNLAEDPNVRKFKIYTSQKRYLEYQQYVRDKNLYAGYGPDVAMFANAPLFKGLPITWVSAMDSGNEGAAYENNFYFIDTDEFKVYVRSGDFFAETAPIQVPSQHRSWYVQVDTSYNFVCTNRRKQAVVASA